MPVRAKDFVRAAEHYGFQLVPGGKHNSKLVKPGARSYPIPSHNGLNDELGDEYVNAFCRQNEIDREEFRRKL